MGAAFNKLMEEETKETLARICCELIDELARLTASRRFLNEDFLKLMNDIGRLGHEKFGADAFEATGGKRRIPRHQKEEIMRHAHRHLWLYEDGVPHDKLGTLEHQNAAAAFNCMLDFIFSQGE